MNRIEEIKKRVDKSDKVLLFDKHEIESLKKITKTTKISGYKPFLKMESFWSIKDNCFVSSDILRGVETNYEKLDVITPQLLIKEDGSNVKTIRILTDNENKAYRDWETII